MDETYMYSCHTSQKNKQTILREYLLSANIAKRQRFVIPMLGGKTDFYPVGSRYLNRALKPPIITTRWIWRIMENNCKQGNTQLAEGLVNFAKYAPYHNVP